MISINTFQGIFENPNVATTCNVINTKYFDHKQGSKSQIQQPFVEKGSFVKMDNATLGYTADISKEGFQVFESLSYNTEFIYDGLVMQV